MPFVLKVKIGVNSNKTKTAAIPPEINLFTNFLAAKELSQNIQSIA